MKLWIVSVAVSCLFSTAGVASGQDDVSDESRDADVRTLNAIVVTGGSSPAIWEMTRGSKTIWIVGTLLPLSRNIPWSSDKIEGRISQSEVVLGPQGMVAGDNIGIFRGLTLWPSIRRTKLNPDGKSLQDLLASATYARWQKAKEMYLGDDDDVERLKPMYAAFELYNAAIKKNGLTPQNLVNPIVARAAKKHDVPIVETKFRLAINDSRNAVKQFTVPQQEDIRCLEHTLDRLDGYLQTAADLGDAWAKGDVSRFQAVQNQRPPVTACWARLTNEAIARQQGVADLTTQIQTKWLDGLHRALREHDTVFATLPIRDVLDSGGTLAALQREGFRLIPPSSVGAVVDAEE